MSADERIWFVLGHATGAIATAALSTSTDAIVASVLVALLHLALWRWKR
jgi:hypothetical protein